MIGTRIAHYEITAKIGEGGMGEVYRATDTKLNRDVALKILPEQFASDSQRMGRFQREAEVLASLSHSNIGTIYGIEDFGENKALVLELIEGPTLAERIAEGPIPIDEALPIALQIAEALEAAHEKGIIHRDLKPANIKLTLDGQVKVLDFGLAKAGGTDPVSSPDATRSPTLTLPATEAGMILGTAAYMSPEQARGQAVDKRSDIWSLGVLLFEMLGGQRAFEGASVPDTLACLLKTEPDWETIPAAVPASVRKLLRCCLAKNPTRRLHDVADVRILLDEAVGAEAELPSAVPTELGGLTRWWPALVGLGLGGLALVYSLVVTPAPPVGGTIRLQVSGETLDFSTGVLPFALSPDGLSLAYIDYDGPATRLFVRRMDSFEGEPIAGTDGAGAPFFSPDGQWIGFFAGGHLKKVALAGGPPTTLCPVPHAPGGATWLEDGTIVYAMAFTPTGLYRVAAAGGQPEVLTRLNRDNSELNHREPQALPGGRTLIFSTDLGSSIQAAVLFLDSGDYTVLSSIQGRVRYVPSGHLLYGTSESVLAAPFDPDTGTMSGAPVSVLDKVKPFLGGASFTVSPAGSLAYISSVPSDLVWVERDGRMTPLEIEDGSGGRPILSRDATRLAIPGGSSFRRSSFLVHDLVRGGRIRLPGFSHIQWLPGDTEMITLIQGDGGSDLYRISSDGAGDPVLVYGSENNLVVTSVSADGRWVLFYEQDPSTSRDIWALRLDGSQEPVKLLGTPASERAAVLSPDGQWFAYASNTSGRDEVYVMRFDPGGEANAYLVSTEGGREPLWSQDGSELFYRVGRAMMVVSVDLRNGFRAGQPRMLFEGNWGVEAGGLNQMYDISPDGGRFLMARVPAESNRINVVLGWLGELERTLAEIRR